MKLKTILNIPDSKYSSKTIFRWLWNAWRGNRTQAVLNAVIGLLSVVISLGQVRAVQHAIDVASHVIDGSLYWAVGIIGILILCGFGLNIASVWVQNILGIKAQNRMQQQLLDRILRSEWEGREKFHSGDVLNRLEIDVNTVVNFLTQTIPSAVSILAMFIGAFVYLFSMDKMLAMITIIIVPAFVLVSKVYVAQMRHLTRKVRTSDSKVQSVLQETIQNRMLIKTLESVSYMVERLEYTQRELRGNVIRRTKFSVFSNVVMNLGFASGYLLAFLWAAIRMYNHSLTFGGMTAFLQLVARIQGPARNLMSLIPAAVGVFTASERLMELEENPLEEQGTPIRLDDPCGIRLDNVVYSYDDDEGKVISHLTFDFPPGTCTAVVGETGAGKTTLVRLLLSLIHPQEGSLEIYNQHESKSLSSRTRANFDYVPQGNTLMSGSIRDNLRLGKLDASDEEMYQALELACAGFVKDLPKGLDSSVQEAGIGLSEGQAQRICIARAILRDRGILLFDEATSALDPETEEQLLKRLLANNGKTIIFITHRQAVLKYVNRTLRIEKT